VAGVFVAKPNDYYSQNLISAPYLLRVDAVNGTKLSRPVDIEYVLEAMPAVVGALEKPGVHMEFEAYESVYQPRVASPWLEGEQGMAFALLPILHIRPKA
jgi:hypothetical protein